MFIRGMKKGLLGLGLAVLLAACGSSGEDLADLESCAKCDTYGGKSWVIDMRTREITDADGNVKKVKFEDMYGETGRYFWGVVIGEELKELDGVDTLLKPADDAVNTYFKMLFKGAGAEEVDFEATFKVIWDQLQNVKEGYPTMIFPDVISAVKGIQVLKRALGVDYQIVVIDEKGNYVAAPGTQNIIPMLKETAPERQTHIRSAMQNGDVISYIHPEYTDMKNLMERRASHVAMHYDLKVGDRELVHHIDNPNGYGPMYNHKPSRHMPFHAWRFKGDSKEKVTAYGLAARNWAMMINDISPFAGFFDLQLKSYADLDRFVEPAMKGEELPKLYCSGLAYTALNLGLNRPLNPDGLGTYWEDYQTKGNMDTDAGTGWLFSDADQPFGMSFLSDGIDNLGSQEKLVFEPYDAVDLLNSWVDNTFRGLPEKLTDVLDPEVVAGLQAGIAAKFAPSMQELKEELNKEKSLQDKEKIEKLKTAVAPLMIYSADNFRLAVIKGVLQSEGFQKQVVGGFSALEWGEPTRAPGPGHTDRTASMPPATVQNAALWTAAWGLSSDSKDDFFEDTCSFVKGIVYPEGEQCDNKQVVDTRYGKMSLKNAAESKQSEKLADAVKAAKTPMEAIKALARFGITNRFVPPRIWIDYGEGDKATMDYLGTVINCELLSAMDGSGADACLGSGGEVKYYKEGGSDSHTYPHFAVRAGGQVTHRRVDASNGPKQFGYGTKVGVKFTAGDPSKILFAVHVPSQWDSNENDAIVSETMGHAVWDYGDICTDRQQAETLESTCAPKWGIALRPNLDSTPVLKHVETFDLLKDANCEIIDEDNMECDLVAQVVENGRTQIIEERGVVGRQTTDGYFVATMINTGEATGDSERQVRRNILTERNVDFSNDVSALMGSSEAPGSAHFDVWRIEIWNNAE